MSDRTPLPAERPGGRVEHPECAESFGACVAGAGGSGEWRGVSGE